MRHESRKVQQHCQEVPREPVRPVEGFRSPDLKARCVAPRDLHRAQRVTGGRDKRVRAARRRRRSHCSGTRPSVEEAPGAPEQHLCCRGRDSQRSRFSRENVREIIHKVGEKTPQSSDWGFFFLSDFFLEMYLMYGEDCFGTIEKASLYT